MDGEQSRDVEELVDQLTSLGVGEDEARQAVADERAAVLLAHRALGGPRVHPLEDVAERTGVPVDVLRARDRSLGLPPADAYTDTDLADAEAFAAVREALNSDALLRAARDDAALLRRLAIVHLQLVREELLDPVLAAGGGESDVATILQEVADPLLERGAGLMASTYRRLLTHLLTTELVARGAWSSGQIDLAVGFVDVIGYTSLSARIDPSGLRELLEGFEARCHDAVSGVDSVEIVKFLGDAAMYVATEPRELAALLLDLVDPSEDAEADEGGPPLSGGLAAGPVLVRSADMFGEPVNLAARLTDLAVGGSLVADEHLADALAPDFHLSRLPSTKLHGIGRRRPLRVRRAEPEGT